MVTKIQLTVRDTNNKSIKMARIQSVKLIPYIGKKVEATIKVIGDA